MALEDRKLWGETHRDQQGVSTNGTNGPIGSSRRGYLHTYPFGKGTYSLADVGQYFVATNPTPGTGIAGIAAADGNDDLENLVSVYNEDTAAGGKRIYLDFLHLVVTAAGTAGSTTTFVSKTDSSDRYTSGGSAITEVNVNRDSSTASIARLHFGALVSPAATSQRLVGHGRIRSVITVVGDTYVVDFGSAGRGYSSSLATAGTAIAHIVIPHVPVIIGPGHSWLFQINAASQTGASSYEFQLGYWEV